MNEMNMELYEKLSRLQWLMQKYHLRTHAESGPLADPTRGQGRIVAILKMQDAISTKDLSYLLGIRVSSLNELLAKMEKNEYITRIPSEADKRVMLVKLTDKGKCEQPDAWKPDSIFSCLSETEQAAFSDYLDRILRVMEDELGKEADERAWWMHGGRERLGDEMFERLAGARRGGFAHDGSDPRLFGRGHGFGGCHHGGEFGKMPPHPHEDPHGQEKDND